MGSRPAVDLMASSRRFPPPWFRRRNRARFIVRDYGQRFIGRDYNGQGARLRGRAGSAGRRRTRQELQQLI